MTTTSTGGRRLITQQTLFLLLFVVAGVVATVGESTYDMGFADTALSVSDQVTTVGWIYFAGYLTEAVASATLGSRIDAWGPLRAMVVFVSLATVVLVVAGVANVVLGLTSILVVIGTAALVDYLNQLVGIAHSAALPEAFGDDETGLIRFSGLDASVRSTASVAAPLVAGSVIVVAPGFRAMFVVAALYATGYLLLLVFLVHVMRTAHARRTASAGAVGTHGLAPHGHAPVAEPTLDPLPAAAAPGEDDRPGLRAVAREIGRSAWWRRFLVVDVLGTVALSTVLLLLYSLFRHDYGLGPRESGLLLGALALGSVVASVVIARGARDGLPRLFGAGCAGSGAGVLLLAVSGGSLAVAGTGAAVLGFGSVLQMKAMTLLVQLNAPRGRVGSWFAVIDTVERVVNALGVLGAAVLMDLVGGPWVFGFAGGLLVACGAWWLRARGRLVTEPGSASAALLAEDTVRTG